MPGASYQEFRLLVANAKSELLKEAGRYRALLNYLELLQRSIDTGEFSDELLESTRDAFPPNLRPMRAATPAGDGLKQSRALWNEINQMVISRKKGLAPDQKLPQS